MKNYRNVNFVKNWLIENWFIKQSDLLEIHQRNKSGLKYYNPNASKEEISETRSNLDKLNSFTSNYFTQACANMHPYGYKIKYLPFTVLYMSEHYFNEDIVKDDETGKIWIYDVYKNEIESSPYELPSLKHIIFYLTSTYFTTPGEISQYYPAPYFVYEILLKNGSYFSDSYVIDFIQHKDDISKASSKMPPKGSNIFDLFEKEISVQSNKLDMRMFIDDVEQLRNEIDNIFKKPFITNKDIKFITNKLLDNEFREHIFNFLTPHLFNHTYTGENINGTQLRDFLEIPITINNDDALEVFENNPDKKTISFETEHGSFNIERIILDFILEGNHSDFRIINHEIMKDELEEEAKFGYQKSINIFDENLNIIDIKTYNDIPEGLYVHTHNTKIDFDTDEKTVEFQYVKTGDPRSLFKTYLVQNLSSLSKIMPPENTIDIVKRKLENIPDINDPGRPEYFYNEIQKNVIFNNFLKNYAEVLESIYRDDYFFFNDQHRQKIEDYKNGINELLPFIKEKLTQQEIETILYDESNERRGFDYNYIFFGGYKNIYDSDIYLGIEKARLVAQGQLVDDKAALDYYNQLIAKVNIKTESAQYVSKIYDMFEKSVGFSEEIQNYFRSQAETFKVTSSKTGQEIFNEGIKNGNIQIKKVSDFPSVMKTLDSITSDFIDSYDYHTRTKKDIEEILESTPIYMVNKMWMALAMREHGVDRIFKDIGLDDARGVFSPFLESINEGKPFVVIYDDEAFREDEFEDVKRVFDIPSEKHGQIITHELIHRLQYVDIEKTYNKGQSVSRRYGDPWLEKPEEIEAIVYGNIPYIYNSILEHISHLINNGDKTIIDTLVEHLVDETKKIESYQIDKIYDKVPEESKFEILKQNEEDKQYEIKIMKDFIRSSIYDVDLNQINEEDKAEYIKEISDNLLQIVMNKWFSQFRIDYASGILSGDSEIAEKMAVKIRENLEKARHEELKQLSKEQDEQYVDPYQTYGRESLQRMIREFPENEKEFFEELKNNPLYQEIISEIKNRINKETNPEFTGNPEDKYKYNVWFFDNGELKIPYSLDGLIQFLNTIKNQYPYMMTNEIGKLINIINKYIETRDKLRQRKQILEKAPPDKERYESDELHELVDLLVGMYSQYGPGWIWTAEKKWNNIVHLSKIKRKFIETKWFLN